MPCARRKDSNSRIDIDDGWGRRPARGCAPSATPAGGRLMRCEISRRTAARNVLGLCERIAVAPFARRLSQVLHRYPASTARTAPPRAVSMSFRPVARIAAGEVNRGRGRVRRSGAGGRDVLMVSAAGCSKLTLMDHGRAPVLEALREYHRPGPLRLHPAGSSAGAWHRSSSRDVHRPRAVS